MIVLEISSCQTKVSNNAILQGVFFFHPFKDLNLFIKVTHGHGKISECAAIKSVLSKKLEYTKGYKIDLEWLLNFLITF